MLPRSGDIRDQSLKWYKIVRNCSSFWPPIFLRGAHYKIDTSSDHAAKFRGDRPRELGERVAKKNITGKTEDLPYYRTGGLKNNKMPEFYLIFARKMPEFFIIIARKIFFPNFREHVPPCPPPVSYEYDFVPSSSCRCRFLSFTLQTSSFPL